ncbi:MAG: RNA 2',3'-cyclic phosphodiesterase [Clostridium sp.]|nr:RNA 2',3'-cyclic phosphodiesterase [Clostridium sp.]
MRLFIAVRLSEEMQGSVTQTLHLMKKLGAKGKFVPSANLHLTLAFLGEVPDAAPVKEAMSSVAWKPFKLSMTELGTFGDTLWVGLKGNQGLSALEKSLREALDSAGIDYDRKKFVPHITMARKFSGNYRQVPAPKGDMMVKKVSLMRSDLKDGKRVYREIFSV